jgi:hypothetical protein
MYKVTYHLTATIEAEMQTFADATLEEFPKMLGQVDKEKMEPVKLEEWKVKLKRWKKLKETYRYTYLVITSLIETDIPAAEKRIEGLLRMLQLNESIKEVTFKQHGEAIAIGDWKK